MKFPHYFFHKFLFKFYPKTSVGLGAIFLVPGNPGISDETISIGVIKNNVGNRFVDFGLVFGPYESTLLLISLRLTVYAQHVILV